MTDNVQVPDMLTYIIRLQSRKFIDPMERYWNTFAWQMY